MSRFLTDVRRLALTALVLAGAACSDDNNTQGPPPGPTVATLAGETQQD